MFDSVIEHFTDQSLPQTTGPEWWLVIGQYLVIVTALGVPFLMHWLENRRHKSRVRDRAKKVWLSVQKETRLLAEILGESDGHWRDPGRHAPHTTLMHQLEIPPVIGTPANWVDILEDHQASLVSELWNALVFYNKWIEFVAAVKAQTSIDRNTEILIGGLDRLWEALRSIDPNIKQPAELLESPGVR